MGRCAQDSVLTIRRQVKQGLRKQEGFTSRLREAAPTVRVGCWLMLQRGGGGDKWHCDALLGKGHWAGVYLLRKMQLAGGLDATLSQTAHKALKVVSAPNVWELHVSNTLHRALAPAARSSFLRLESCVAYKDSTWLVSTYKRQVSLQDVINCYRKANKKMEETLIMFYATELLRAVEALHATGVLHADIKPDNILLRDDDESNQASWSYTPAAGFGDKGVELIDYGCAIDRNLYPPGTVFSGRSGTVAFECVEMLTEATWTTQVDWFAVASTIHCLLHNVYMDVNVSVDEAGGITAAPKLPLKRYWQVETQACAPSCLCRCVIDCVWQLTPDAKVEIWSDFFDCLLNGGAASDPAALRLKLEAYWAANPAKCAAVRVGLMKQAILVDQFLE